MPRPKKVKITTANYIDRLESEVKNNQSRLSLILGILIIIVAGILVFNYFQKNRAEVGPAQNTTTVVQDVTPDQLPGKYTVKEGDTLFDVAQKYYNDGSKFDVIAQNNKLANADEIETGQVLEISKLDTITPTETAPPTPAPTVPPASQEKPASPVVPTTNFGPVINDKVYTVQEGDWLSKIAARAYHGNIMAFRKLAQANNIANPDLIFPGQVINIPR